MALVAASTAELLIQKFHNNDVDNKMWTISGEDWEFLQELTAGQGREVVNAAKYNKSIRTLTIEVPEFDDERIMNDEAIGNFSFIVSQLRHVDRVEISQGYLNGTNTRPTKAKTIDKLYKAIAECPSDVRHLDCSHFSRLFASRWGLIKLAQSFPNLEVLEVGVPQCDSKHRPAEDFAMAFAVVTARTLTSLRRVCINVFSDPYPVALTLLSSLHASTSLRAIDLNIVQEDDDLVRAAKCFCASHTSVERFTVRGFSRDDPYGDPICMTNFFDIGPIPSFSPSITHVEFFQCNFDHKDRKGLVQNAVKALQYVQYLRFGQCQFRSAMKVVQSLPRLTKFSCVSRAVMDEAYEPRTGEEDEVQYILTSNDDIKDLCLAVEQEGSLLNDIEVDLGDLHTIDSSESFPAIARLMGACKGRLVLNMCVLPWRVGAHIAEGAQRLRPDLKDLRLRFENFDLEDPNYADIIESFVSNKTLTHIELGFDSIPIIYRERETMELSSEKISNLIGSNHTLQTLSLRNIPRNGASTMLEAIMTALKTENRSLRALEFLGSLPADCLPGARDLAHDMLKENDVLSTLKGLDIPKGGPVENLLLQNRYGKIFLRANDATPIGIWPTVLGRVSRDRQIGVMYKFVRAKPDVVRPRDLRASSGVAGRKRGWTAEE